MKILLKKIYLHLPDPIKNFQNWLRIKERILLIGKTFREYRIIKKIQKKAKEGKTIQIVFYAMSVSFWKCDSLFKLLQQQKNFEPVILLLPRPNDPKEIQENHIKNMEIFFRSKKFRYIKTIEEFKKFNPDIIFFAQPYKNSVPEYFRIYNHLDKLTCYIPYAFFISNYKWAYDTLVHNLAWKLFYPSELHKRNAQQIALNHGKNVEIVGYPIADKFSTSVSLDPWKIKDRSRKRVIYAAHHSVLDQDLANCSSFLQYADIMFETARKNSQCQFAFKPHPHLKEHLYQHSLWGKEKTDNYFTKWNNLPNTFLVEGDYIDLFKTSDALIHDCGSFTVEYLYVNKPVLFIGNNQDKILCNFGKMVHNANYHLEDYDIDTFLRMIQGKSTLSKNGQNKGDFKESLRLAAQKKYLFSQNGKTFANNVFDFLKRTFTE